MRFVLRWTKQTDIVHIFHFSCLVVSLFLLMAVWIFVLATCDDLEFYRLHQYTTSSVHVQSTGKKAQLYKNFFIL